MSASPENGNARAMDPFRFLFRVLRPVLSHPAFLKMRFAWIAFHLVAIVLVSAPAPVRARDKEQWNRPSVQTELKNWSARLGQVGIRMSPEEVQSFAQSAVDGWVEKRSAVLRPLEVYLRQINTRQAWYMFTGPDREPQRFQLSYTKSSGESVRVFEMGRELWRPDLVHPDFLYAYRVRRALLFASWGRGKGTFEHVCRYFRRDLKKRASDVNEVSCRLIAQRVEHPSRRGEVRPDREVRAMSIRKNGFEKLSGEGAPSRAPKSKEAPRKKSKKAESAEKQPSEEAPQESK